MPLTPEYQKQLDEAIASIPGPSTKGGGGRIRPTLADYDESRSNAMNHESSLFHVGGELFSNLKNRGQDLKKIVDRQSGPNKLGFVETGLQTAGAVAGGVSDVAGAVLKGSYHLLAPKVVEDAVSGIGQDILHSDIGQSGMEALHKGLEYWDEFAAAHPDAAKDIESVVDIASVIPNVKAATAAAKTVGTVGKAAVATAKGLGRGTAAIINTGKDVLERGVVNSIKDGATLLKDTASGLKRGFTGTAARAADDVAGAAAGTVDDAALSVADDVAAASIPKTSALPKKPLSIAAPIDDQVDIAAQEAMAANRGAVQRATGATVAPEMSASEQVGSEARKLIQEKAPRLERAMQGVTERWKPNVNAKKIEEQAYKSLAPEGQKAVRNGLLRRDVEAFTSANDKEKGILREMVDAAENNTNNRGTAHPSDLVGKEMNRRIKLLDDQRKVIGKDLGEHVKGLKTKDLGGMEQVQSDVVKRLNEVPGLEGIKTKIGEGGKVELDFSDTAMRGSQTEAARKELQSIFDDMNDSTPYQLHRQRQELFEALGGKKAAQLQLTETQEQGMDAVREGIADSLERISKGYKDLNGQYREVVTPLREMRKFYKGTEGAAEDVLDAKGGLLARRLTSNVASAPELRRILDEIGSQLAKRGQDVSDIDLNKLQDFYNALNRYYDITKDTTFEGLIKSANVNPTEFTPKGIAKKAIDKVFENAYITKDTQRAALKELIGH